MSEYREIITKAVVAKGRKFSQCTHTITPSQKPASILGGWIINHNYDAHKKGKTVVVVGTYDISVWYSYKENTKTEVVTERVEYEDVIKLRYKDDNFLDDEHEVICIVLQQPNCLEVTISPNGNKIIVQADQIINPVFVRYAWSNNPDVNLFNKEGLPAVPFTNE